MTIRLARPVPEEAETFAALHVACWKEAYRGLVPDALLDGANAAIRLPLWETALADPQRIVIGAYDDAAAAGFIMTGPAAEMAAVADGHVHALYLRASHTRRGLGARLLAAAALGWLGRGGRSLSVGVLAANHGARAFYAAMGGRLARTGHYDWDGYRLEDALYVFEDLNRLAAST